MNAEQLALATQCHLEGKSIYEIAPLVGRDPSTVAKALRKPEIRARIEREAEQIINRGLKVARRTITRLAAEGNKGKDPAMLKLALDASKHITSMAGLSGNAPSTIINAMIQINSAPEESKEVQDIRSFLQAKLINATEVSQSETIDVPVRDNAIDVAPSHTVTDCAEIAQLEAKQDVCQDAEVEGSPADGLKEAQEQG